MQFDKSEFDVRVREIKGELHTLVEAFSRHERKIYLVGGSVRDAILSATHDKMSYPKIASHMGDDSVGDFFGDGSLEDDPRTDVSQASADQSSDPSIDYDLTTDAMPNEVEAILSSISRKVWTVGAEYGTISALIGSRIVEITTHRGDLYRSDSRKPVVTMPTTLEEDLIRRDFRINAMALDLSDESPSVIDLFDGMGDLRQGLIRTPREPEKSFDDDPLRMLRACRFAAQLNFRVDEGVVLAMSQMASRIEIISPERLATEFNKLMVTPKPSLGLRILNDTGLTHFFLPELSQLALEQDPIHHHKDVLEHTYSVIDKTEANLELRLGALFHDIGKPATRRFEKGGVTFYNHDKVGSKMTKKRMRALRYSSEMIQRVSRLVYLHLRFHTYEAGWTDRAVRRYVVDAGDLLDNLNALTLADCTTRNANKVRALEARMQQLKVRIQELRAQEELDSLRPELDGTQVMQILGIAPSKEVGVALEFLMELRIEEGLIGEDQATKRLLTFWQERNGRL
ncbi:CCA tRNA nucleotidyltransferase [Acidithrix ferrooxidans]|uniref:CCA-adding enzyme n=1 Tax=Acidithrix ferrooxidans TaxID=1280514 RepID=A0A0D8HFT2_9ACTN|nr:CCA tRNA nucleotidyltransferase [Acidithrix ferrooxidans]KJF16744.1 CCA-adding enzyme [Acidithrix ferrooxidans]